MVFINRDYLPDDRLEAFRPFLDDYSSDMWLRGWYGRIHDVRKADENAWIVRLSFTPYLDWSRGGVVCVQKVYLETWRFNAVSQEAELLSGKALGLGFLMVD